MPNSKDLLLTPQVPPRQTEFSPTLEDIYQNWAMLHNVPQSNDYDMRGFYLGGLLGDPAAKSGVNSSDGLLHFSDKFKLPNHQSFSRESMYSKGLLDPSWLQLGPPYKPDTWAQKTIDGLRNYEFPQDK